MPNQKPILNKLLKFVMPTNVIKMYLIYGLGIRMYYFAILIASVFHWKARKYIKGRYRWEKVLAKQLINGFPKIWIYCPSIGEFQECRTFVKRIAAEKKNCQFVYTFHSPSGYDQAKIPGENAVRLLLPIDTGKNARTFLDIVKPEQMYVLASGVWPNYVSELTRRKIPHYMVSFYGREDSAFFKPRFNSFYKPLFTSFENIFCYNEKCKELLAKHFNYQKAVVAGNLRFDCVIDMKKNLSPVNGIKEFVNGKFCFVAGSTEKKEDELIVKAFEKLKHLDIKWIIVPHEKLPKALSNLKKKFGPEMCFYSKDMSCEKKILVMDITGFLFQLYDYADICLVGRGFHRLEIHNMLEPAVFLKPVLIGPKHKKFVEPTQFISQKLAFEFKEEQELSELITGLYSDEIKIDNMAGQKIFDSNSGGTEIVMKSVLTPCSRIQN